MDLNIAGLERISAFLVSLREKGVDLNSAAAAGDVIFEGLPS